MRVERVRDRCLLVMCLFAAGILVLGQVNAADKWRTQPRTSVFESKQFDLNRINCMLANDGIFAYDRKLGIGGLEWPKGSGTRAVFTAGIWIAGKNSLNNSIQSSVAYFYATDFQPGTIDGVYSGDTSVAANSNDPRFHIYKISREDSIGGVNPDYDEWPSDQGAPVDERGKPKFFGHQQLFCVFNDLNLLGRQDASVGPPMGIEVRMLVWGHRNPPLDDVMFLRWVIINKSVFTYDSTYFSIFSDIDMGDANDDQQACDTVLSLGYFYNGDEVDGYPGFGYGDKPPATGYVLLQGPRGDSDERLPMTSYIANQKNINPTWFNDIPTGVPEFPRKAFYYMKGLNNEGGAIVNPVTGQVTTFMLSGDPVAGTGWLPTHSNIRPHDQRLHINSGPFTFAPGDTQEVIAAFVIAQGENRFDSITKLKSLTQLLRDNFPGILTTTERGQELPERFTLSQNYPNPFNPVTSIIYELPGQGRVTMKVYDILGREVVTLLDEVKTAGRFTVQWDGRNGFGQQVSTGLYLYRLTAGGFVQTRKMLLLR